MLADLLSRLPTELVLHIFHCAARAFVHTDRAWVVQLALVSRDIYQVVHPVLYHTIVATWGAIFKLHALAQDEAGAHVFRAARRLVVIGNNLDDWTDDEVRHAFAGVTSIDAPIARVQALSSFQDFHPRMLAVRFHFLATFVDELPQTTLASVTHLIGYFPSAGQEESTLTADGTVRLFATMPALTHLAFEMLDVSKQEDSEAGPDGDPLDLGALEVALRTALSQPRTQVVAMRFCGDWLSYYPAVADLALKLQDPRVFIWEDTRRIQLWEDVWECATSDAWAGRTIFTEARQVWPPALGATTRIQRVFNEYFCL